MKFRKIFFLLLFIFLPLTLVACGGGDREEEDLDKNALFDYVKIVDFTEMKKIHYIEADILITKKDTSILTEENTFTENVKMYIHETQFYVGIDATSPEEDEEYISRLEADGTYFKYWRSNGSGVYSENITFEKFVEERENLLNEIFSEEWLPSSAEQITSGKSLLKGLTSLKIEFQDEDHNHITITLNKFSSSVSMKYRLGEVIVNFAENQDESDGIIYENITIKFKYPYQFNFTEFPQFV